ncbi:MAG: hypothetical protein A2284_16730 [Deltaproteobacteria bacterium RIFOXYA12_FULL_61_11]|nr:MAG: hypothetical protein A2284_16730 [Deltaproteobacteria bacterium RIFOXYA12_FULL_61_11]
MKILGLLLLLTACYEGELERTNPFDPENPKTRGNPFELKVQSEASTPRPGRGRHPGRTGR